MQSPLKIPTKRLIAPMVAVLLLLKTGRSQLPEGDTTVPNVSAKPGPPPTSTGVNGQFVIHGADLSTRGAFMMLCDETAVSLGKLLRDDGKFLIPVVVVLKSPPDITLGGPAISTNINQLSHGGFHLQMNVQLRPDFLTENFSRELVRILLAERILRNHKELQTKRQRVLPDWVLTGVSQALEFRSRSRPSAFFAAVFQRGQVYSVDKLLSADPAQLDSLSRGIYETSSCALVLALLDQPDGSLRFLKFLNSLALDDKPDRELLKDSFPTLAASRNSLEKWWSLQMATLATPASMETLGVEETEAKLNEALALRFDPLPEKSKKEKSKTINKTDPSKASGKPVEEPKKKRTSFFSPSGFNYPFVGGMNIAITPKSNANTDAAPEDAPKKKAAVKDARLQAPPATKAATEKSNAPPAKLKTKPHNIAERPVEAPKTAPESKKNPETQNKPEPSEENQKKRSLLNPLNWFRGKEKPAEPATSETPKKKPDKSDSSRRQDGSLDNQKSGEQGTKVAAGPSLNDYQLIANRPDRGIILQRNIDLLAQLKLQANPLYRPLINDYAEVISLLMKGKDRGTPAKLAALDKRRGEISRKARAVESYADWYEASETKGYSGVFEDYLRLGEKIDKEIRPRTDAISKYLDALAKEYE